jgi:hypothetical protein
MLPSTGIFSRIRHIFGNFLTMREIDAILIKKCTLEYRGMIVSVDLSKACVDGKK